MPRRLLSVIVTCLIVVSIPALLVSLVEKKPFLPPVRIQTSSELTVQVLDRKTGQVRTLPLETYLVGVVAAEMPARFHPSALAAQAIAARTYTIKRLRQGGLPVNSGHPQADLCTDPSHCQASKSDQMLLQDWGLLHFASNYRKLSNAVESTRGLVITYQGELIDPVYHSTCGGATENSEDAWVYRVPYLRSVSCPYCRNAPHYQDEYRVSWSELSSRLQIPLLVPAAAGAGKKQSQPAAAELAALLKVESRSPTGRVKTLKVGTFSLTGAELRSRLGLASTRLRWQTDRQGVTFFTQGYGHGVGLCQYGAQGLAQEGKTPAEILKYYYQGVEIQRLGN